MYTRDGEAPMLARVDGVHNDDDTPYYIIVTSSGSEINTDHHHLKRRPKASSACFVLRIIYSSMRFICG